MPCSICSQKQSGRTTNAELQSFKTYFRRACCTVKFLFKSPRTATLARYSGISYPTVILSGFKSSSWPCLGSSHFREVSRTVQSFLTPGGLRFHFPWAESGFWNRLFLYPSGSKTAIPLFESSPPSLLRLCLSRGVSNASLRSSLESLVATRVSKSRKLTAVIGRRLLFFFLPSVTFFWWERKSLDTPPTRRWERFLRERPMFLLCLRDCGKSGS